MLLCYTPLNTICNMICSAMKLQKLWHAAPCSCLHACTGMGGMGHPVEKSTMVSVVRIWEGEVQSLSMYYLSHHMSLSLSWLHLPQERHHHGPNCHSCQFC